MRTLAIIGGGSWGTALSVALAPRFERIRLWFHEPGLAAETLASRENRVFLTGIPLPLNIEPLADIDVATADADLVMGVMPSHAARGLYRRMRSSLTFGTPVVSATKGIDSVTLMRMSQVIEQELPGSAVCVLSGPSFAREVAEGRPTALVCGGRDAALVSRIQAIFSSESLRLYGSPDPVGVEMGGALKNVIAIAAGICDGLALGHNALAALITRGLAEITRLSVACGAVPDTLAGLAGLGDLVLTCTSDMSRNRQVGLRLASGAPLDNIVASTRMIAEGVGTAALAIQLAEKKGVDMPITAEMHAVMSDVRPPREAIARLMTRSLKHETQSYERAIYVSEADGQTGRNSS